MLKSDSIKVLLGRLPAADKAESLLRFSLTLLLALLIANNLANLSWQLAAPLFNRKASSAMAAPPQQRSAKSVASPGHSRASEEIALFGRADTSATSTQSSQLEEAPATTLNMTLKGVIAIQPMSRALAIIAEKGGNNEQLYGLGDQIPGNATIRVIYPDRVIINRSGMLETLFLEGSQPAGTTDSSQPAGRNRTRSANVGGTISSLGDGTSFEIQQNYWNQRLADLPGLSREVGVQIYKENDKQMGYKLMASRGSSLLSSLGLQAGDILLSVNGRAMNSVQNGLAAYQEIRNGGQVRIEIIRNGQRESRVYNIGG
jgi:general secretion pathway protein C